MAGDPRFTRLLLGLGLTEFSMHPGNVLEVKRQIIESDVGLLRERMAQILDGTDGLKLRDEVEALTHL
jgi:phosphotransferase system enzyme I (PtsI)